MMSDKTKPVDSGESSVALSIGFEIYAGILDIVANPSVLAVDKSFVIVARRNHPRAAG